MHQEILMKYLDKVENVDQRINRSNRAKEYLRQVIEAEPLKDGEKIGVVTHFVTIANMTAKGLDPEHRLGIRDMVMPENC